MRLMLVVVFATLASCASNVGSSGDGGAQCVPGASAPCSCVNGSRGAMSCAADGVYGACTCTSAVDGGDVADVRDVASVDADAQTSRDGADAIGDAADRESGSDATDTADADAGDARDTSVDACANVLCATACVDIRTDVHHCGSCTNDCTTLQGIDPTAVTCANGTCSIATACAAGRADCNANPSDGCETDLSGAMNCGGCGVVCNEPTPVCTVGSSGTASCVSGCSGTTPTRCAMSCVDTSTDVRNCGGCGSVCPLPANATSVCTASVCGFVCLPGFADCDHDPSNGCELSTSADPANCGACGNVCTPPLHATSVCGAGICGFVCDTGYAPSGATCVSTDPCIGSWPEGNDGPLVVAAGQTVTIAAGSVHDYSMIDIQAGGTLAIAPGAEWTIIGCSGDMIVDGTLLARAGAHAAAVATTRAPAVDGTPTGDLLTFATPQSEGGAGGSTGAGTVGSIQPGGSPIDGNGGGGASYEAAGAAASPGRSGGGAAAYGLMDAFAAGVAPYGTVGTAGMQESYGIAGGGSGGGRGLHGQPVYIRVEGSVSGAGVIDARGSDGGVGGAGGPTQYVCPSGSCSGTCPAVGGSGGGGGAGGSGGTVVLRYVGTYTPLTILVDPGHGGVGGAGGPGLGCVACTPCSPSTGSFGAAGSDGMVGVIDVAASACPLAPAASCPNGTTTLYRDLDGDGHGDATVSITDCAAVPGWVTSSDDCYDADAFVAPGQTMYFPGDRGDGSYDVDCDGAASEEWPSSQAGCMSSGFRMCSPFTSGWFAAPPPCGGSNGYMTMCLSGGGFCSAFGAAQMQSCR